MNLHQLQQQFFYYIMLQHYNELAMQNQKWFAQVKQTQNMLRRFHVKRLKVLFVRSKLQRVGIFEALKFPNVIQERNS